MNYVVGFMFDKDNPRRVALIKKNRPAWQAGLLNGIGGKVEPKELFLDAIIREFWEETGVKTHYLQWVEVCNLEHAAVIPEWCIRFYAAYGNVSELRSTTDEDVLVFDVSCVNADNAIPNLTWLLPLAQLVLNGSINPTRHPGGLTVIIFFVLLAAWWLIGFGSILVYTHLFTAKGITFIKFVSALWCGAFGPVIAYILFRKPIDA